MRFERLILELFQIVTSVDEHLPLNNYQYIQVLVIISAMRKDISLQKRTRLQNTFSL